MNVETASLLKPGAVVDGKYPVDVLLGQGGRDKAFCVTHLQPKKTFALKVRLFDAARNTGECQRQLARFRCEAEVPARVSHPNIVRVTDSGMPGEKRLPYVVMGFIRNRILCVHCRELGPATIEFSLGVMRPICAVFHTVHAQGIVCRDLKTASVTLQTLPHGATIAFARQSSSLTNEVFEPTRPTQTWLGGWWS